MLWAKFTQRKAGAKAVSTSELLTQFKVGLGMIVPHGPVQLTCCDFQAVPKTLRSHRPWEIWVMFLFFVDQGQPFSLTGKGVRGQKADSAVQDHLDSTYRSASPTWLPYTRGHSQLQ